MPELGALSRNPRARVLSFPEGADDENTRAIGTPGTSRRWDLSKRQHTQPLAQAGLDPYLSLVTGTRVHASPEQAHHDWFDGDAERGYAGPGLALHG